MAHRYCLSLILVPLHFSCWFIDAALEPQRLGYTVQLQTIMEHDDGQFLWYHPRAVVWPREGLPTQRQALITLQKHLRVSDYYSGLYVMQSDDAGTHWSAPQLVPSLDWRSTSKGVTIAVADVTPGYYAPMGKVLI